MTVLIYFLSGLAVCAWLGVIMWLFSKAEVTNDLRAAAPWLVAMVVTFCLPVAWFLAFETQGPVDPNAHRLCAAGHQEWYTRHSAVLVGKIVMPTTWTEKLWICDRWED